MGVLDFFTKSNTGESGSGDSVYNEKDVLFDNYRDLSYKECLNIYRYFPLGKRIARALPTFAMSAPRFCDFKDLPPICIDEFTKLEKDLKIQELIKDLTTQARIFGASTLFVACDNVAQDEPLLYRDIQKYGLAFTIQDPLTTQSLTICQEPNNQNFRKVTACNIGGAPAHLSRVFVAFNDMNLYLQWTPSNFSFGSCSVYQNMLQLIKSWNRCIIALERLATKSSVIVFKNRESGAISGATAYAAKKALNLIRDLQNDGAVSIARDDSVEAFPLTGVEVVDRIVQNMNAMLAMALNDTPAAVLLDKELAQGFGNGTEDMKAILMAVDDFRDSKLTPIYKFIDKFLIYKMCSPEFLERLRNEDATRKFAQMSNGELLELIINSFSYEWGSLYPESEATRVDNQSRKLNNLGKLRELGANIEDIQTILNNDKTLYSEEILLDSPDTESEIDYLGGERPRSARESNAEISNDIL